MFLGFRTFADRQKAIIVTVSVLMLVFTVTGLASFITLVMSTETTARDIPIDQWVLAVAILGLVVTLITLYIPWTLRYRYYFKLYLLLIKRVGHNSAVLFASRGETYRVEREKATIYRISLLDPKGNAVRAFAVVSNGYLKQVELDKRGDLALEPTVRYLGPMRDISDAKVFKKWHDALKHARVVHVEQ